MGFVLSKIAWALISPCALLFFALAAAWLWQRRRPALSRGLVGLCAVFLGVQLLCPVGSWVIAPLEHRFDRPDPAKVDGIVVLGGAVETAESIPGDLSLNDAAERITTMVALARRYPGARLVYSGGSGLARHPGPGEAGEVKPLLEAMGLPDERVIYEDRSRNTWENAIYSKQLVQPKPGETWLLVTSAWHMPRAIGCFRSAGWPVVAYPVDYLSRNLRWANFDAPRQLYTISLAEKEWIGLLAYRLMGRTDALFPAPSTTHQELQ